MGVTVSCHSCFCRDSNHCGCESPLVGPGFGVETPENAAMDIDNCCYSGTATKTRIIKRTCLRHACTSFSLGTTRYMGEAPVTQRA